MENSSARHMWGDFLDAHLEYAFVDPPKVLHFCNTELEANRCTAQVLDHIKKATTYSLLGLQHRKESLPKIGSFMVITNWEGKAKCIVRTTAVQIKPFFSISQEYAIKEAITDPSLEEWKKATWERFSEELKPFNKVPKESMIVVCQEFEKVF